MTPSGTASVTSSVDAPTSSPVRFRSREALAAGRETNARATPDEATEVLGLRKWPARAWRAHLERVAATQLRERARDALCVLERDPIRMVDEDAQRRPRPLHGQHFDRGLDRRDALLDFAL